MIDASTLSLGYPPEIDKTLLLRTLQFCQLKLTGKLPPYCLAFSVQDVLCTVLGGPSSCSAQQSILYAAMLGTR